MLYRPVILIAALLSIACFAGELLPVSVIEEDFKKPDGTTVAGAMLRPLLLVKVEERGEQVFKDPTFYTIWVFDPTEPGKGLAKIVRKPGSNHTLYFRTPLFGGWGIAHTSLNAEGAEGPSSTRWFNLLTGQAGAVVDWNFLHARSTREGILIKDGKNRLCRYDPASEKLKIWNLPIEDERWVSEDVMLGWARLHDADQCILLDIGASSMDILGVAPFGQQADDGSAWRPQVQMAGPGGRDGYFTSAYEGNVGFSLWYLPPLKPAREAKAQDWVRVLKDIPITKTFGGAPPWLPVQYLGDGCFAVAKTIREEVPDPPGIPDGERFGHAAEAVTLWVEGKSGKILGTSEPYGYYENPPLRIPDSWVVGGKPHKAANKPVSKYFTWDKDANEVIVVGGARFPIAEAQNAHCSHDGRYLLIYDPWVDAVDGKATAILRIIDGVTGIEDKREIQSPFHQLHIECSWELLCSPKPAPEVLEQYGRRNEFDLREEFE